MIFANVPEERFPQDEASPGLPSNEQTLRRPGLKGGETSNGWREEFEIRGLLKIVIESRVALNAVGLHDSG